MTVSKWQAYLENARAQGEEERLKYRNIAELHGDIQQIEQLQSAITFLEHVHSKHAESVDFESQSMQSKEMRKEEVSKEEVSPSSIFSWLCQHLPPSMQTVLGVGEEAEASQAKEAAGKVVRKGKRNKAPQKEVAAWMTWAQLPSAPSRQAASEHISRGIHSVVKVWLKELWDKSTRKKHVSHKKTEMALAHFAREDQDEKAITLRLLLACSDVIKRAQKLQLTIDPRAYDVMFKLLRHQLCKTWKLRGLRAKYENERKLHGRKHAREEAPPLVSQHIDEKECALEMIELFKKQCADDHVAQVRPHYYWVVMRVYNLNYPAQYAAAMGLLREAAAVLETSAAWKSAPHFGQGDGRLSKVEELDDSVEGRRTPLFARLDTVGMMLSMVPLLTEARRSGDFADIQLIVRCLCKIQYQMTQPYMNALIRLVMKHDGFEHACMLLELGWWWVLQKDQVSSGRRKLAKAPLFVDMLAEVLLSDSKAFSFTEAEALCTRLLWLHSHSTDEVDLGGVSERGVGEAQCPSGWVNAESPPVSHAQIRTPRTEAWSVWKTSERTRRDLEVRLAVARIERIQQALASKSLERVKMELRHVVENEA